MQMRETKWVLGRERERERVQWICSKTLGLIFCGVEEMTKMALVWQIILVAAQGTPPNFL